MEKFYGYVGIVFTIVLAYLLLSPIDSPYRYYGSPAAPQINFLDDLPASHFVNHFNSKYDIFVNMYQYKKCRALKPRDECDISYENFGETYQFLIDNVQDFSENEQAIRNAGFERSTDEIAATVKDAILMYEGAGLRGGLSLKIYFANFIVLAFILFLLIRRRWVGKALMKPFLVILRFFRRIHKTI